MVSYSNRFFRGVVFLSPLQWFLQKMVILVVMGLSGGGIGRRRGLQEGEKKKSCYFHIFVFWNNLKKPPVNIWFAIINK